MYQIFILILLAIAPVNIYPSQRAQLIKTAGMLKKMKDQREDGALAFAGAVIRRDFEAGKKEAQQLLDEGISINCRRYFDGATPLLIATMYGNVPMMQWLLERGACPFTTDAQGQGIFHYASGPSETNNPLYFLMTNYRELFLATSSYPTIPFTKPSFRTFFIQKTGIPAREAADIIFEYADAPQPPTRDELTTALHKAIRYQNLGQIRFFLAQGADINGLSDPGNRIITPLMRAIQGSRHAGLLHEDEKQSLDVIKFILQHDPDLLCKNTDGEAVEDFVRKIFLMHPGDEDITAKAFPISTKILEILAEYKKKHEEQKDSSVPSK